jgi:hypothetical protein
MSEVERLRRVAANYSRMAGLVFREDIRSGLLRLAAETLEKARGLERQETEQPVDSIAVMSWRRD